MTHARRLAQPLSIALSVTLGLALGACAMSPTPQCRPGEQAAVNDTSYFGTARPGGGRVSSDEWASFLATVVTPRFPDGFSVWPAAGQWRAADGSVVHEDAYVLNLVHPDDTASEAALRAIAADYKSRFGQEAVLRVRSPACMSL
jgi:Protein of unknown function (DUF3574)